MIESLKSNVRPLTIARLGAAAVVIGEALCQGQGIRLGQSSVLSNKVHAFNAHSPEHVQILVNADAGQVFYYRQDNGRIGHLDIFHECGRVDHQMTAQYICLALEFYQALARAQAAFSGDGQVNPDFVDIQTATGGGRITGHLRNGQKPSVRRVHENHVHVALLLPQDSLVCLFYIVAAVETAIMDLGLELRCNECISYVEGADCQADLSPYADNTDSLLTGQPAEKTGQQAWVMPNTVLDIDCNVVPVCGASASYANPDLLAAKQGRSQTYVGVDEFQPADKLRQQRQAICQVAGGEPAFSVPALYDCYKQALWQGRQRPGKTTCKKVIRKYQELGSKAVACTCQPGAAGFDVTATVNAVAERLLTEELSGGLLITAKDLRYSGCRQRPGADICLLVDSSGSMAGERIQAARQIAAKISHFGGGRISLVAFQDKRAVILRPFTHNRQAVLTAFAEIVPQGATPLALGIKYALAYVKEQQSGKALLVLITDGMPSKRYDENIQPLAEALSAADELRKENYGFLCIGLGSNADFLQKLTTAGGGVLFPL
jgi:magnesium chelatase subunit D